MEKIEFLAAKNGSLSCKYDGKALHSLYNPDNEGERFASSIIVDFNPKIITLIEPCIGYCIPHIKKIFPDAKIAVIHIHKDFIQYDKEADYSFLFEDSLEFETKYFETFGEEAVYSTLFINWEPAAKCFSKETEQVWKSIKNILNKAVSILYTHDFFAKRWIKNSIKISSNIKQTAILPKIKSPVVITASGPSLTSSIPSLKKYRNKFFLIAVSSSLSVLDNYGITPDLVISTDGGFWAKKHLETLLKENIPLALSCEGNCPTKVLTQNPVIPLVFSDGIESTLLKKITDCTLNAERNGTVSGTAVELALSLTDKDVFCFGLDLFAGKGKQHADPNIIENSNQIKDCKINSKETRINRSRFNAGSLKIYETWFQTRTEPKWTRCFRVSKKGELENQLGKIQDIDISDFENLIKNLENYTYNVQTQNISGDYKKTISNFIKNTDYQTWKKFAFPLDSINIEKSKNIQDKEKLENKIKLEIDNFIKSLGKIYNA